MDAPMSDVLVCETESLRQVVSMDCNMRRGTYSGPSSVCFHGKLSGMTLSSLRG